MLLPLRCGPINSCSPFGFILIFSQCDGSLSSIACLLVELLESHQIFRENGRYPFFLVEGLTEHSNQNMWLWYLLRLLQLLWVSRPNHVPYDPRDVLTPTSQCPIRAISPHPHSGNFLSEFWIASLRTSSASGGRIILYLNYQNFSRALVFHLFTSSLSPNPGDEGIHLSFQVLFITSHSVVEGRTSLFIKGQNTYPFSSCPPVSYSVQSLIYTFVKLMNFEEKWGFVAP